MKKHPKMDRYLISVEQEHELDTAVARLKKKEGIDVSRDDIRAAVAAVGRSRRKVYKYIREKLLSHEVYN